jgi:hypothetical protein
MTTSLERQRAQGMPGASTAPAAWRANEKSTPAQSLQVKPKHRHSPRDGVNALYRAHPGETGLCCLRRPRIIEPRTWHLHRGAGPARLHCPQSRRTSSGMIASIASRLNVRDDWPNAPLVESGQADNYHAILKNGREIFTVGTGSADHIESARQIRFYLQSCNVGRSVHPTPSRLPRPPLAG